MGQIFNRIKRIGRSWINSAIDKIEETCSTIKNKTASFDEEDGKNIDIDEEWQKLISETRDRARQTINPKMAKLARHYKALGLKFGEGLTVVTAKWKNFSKENHPDRFPDPKEKERADKHYRDVSVAYQAIKDYFDNKD